MMGLGDQKPPADIHTPAGEEFHMQSEIGLTAAEAPHEMAWQLLAGRWRSWVAHGRLEPVFGVHVADPTLSGVTAEDRVADLDVRYTEVLRAPLWTWLLPPLAGAFLGLAYGYALGAGWGWLTAVVLTFLGCWLLLSGSRRITVSAAGLRVGRALLPLWAVGEVRSLDADESLAARRHRANADAYLVLRTGYSDRTVAVAVADESDPHPYWLISTRRPDELVSAIVGARDSGTRTRPSTSSSTS